MRTTSNLSRAGRLVSLGALALGASVALASGVSAAASSASTTPVKITSQSQLTTLLQQGASATALPTVVDPPASLATSFTNTKFCLLNQNLSDPVDARPVDSQCSWGDLNAKKTVVLFGDSQAGMWVNAFDTLGKADHFKVVLYANAACDIASTELWNYYSLAGSQGCTAFKSWALKRFETLKPAAIVAIYHPSVTSYNYLKLSISPLVYSTALTSTFKQLSQASKDVIVVSDIPNMDREPATCLSIHANAINVCGVAASVGTSDEDIPTESAAASAAGVHFVNTSAWYCTSSFCPVEANHTILYFDEYHLTKYYTAELEPLLAQVLAKNGLS